MDLTYIKDRFCNQFPGKSFDRYLEEYNNLKAFAPNGNINDSQKISDEAHFIMRTCTQYYLLQAFNAMKIDMNDPNVAEDLNSGNIGTPGRIAKVWCGFDTHDMSEMLSGRWNDEPRMAAFPNDKGESNPVFVTTKLDAVCSHHFIRFGDTTADESMVIVGYLPRKKLGGISKINRYVQWCAKRGWLQEDLTNYIGKKVEEAFETDSVYVALLNLSHGCTAYRGAEDRLAATSTIYTSGEFKDNLELVPSRFRG